MYVVLKRDGSKDTFKKEKIFTAVVAAGGDSSLGFRIAQAIEEEAVAIDLITVDQIQRRVIQELEERNRYVAENYKEYAEQRTEARESKFKLMDQVMGILEQTNSEILHENANKDSTTLPVMMNLVAEETIKYHFSKNVLPKHLKAAHYSGDIYIHDMGMIGLPTVNCCLVAVATMLRTGFKMGNVRIEQPNGILTAANIVCQIVQSVSSHTYGGTTVPDLDLVLEPYAAKSFEKHRVFGAKHIAESDAVYAYAKDMTLKEIRDAAQLMEYQIQTMLTSNGQSPFITFSFGRGESWYAREIQKAILNQRIEGIGKHKTTPVFPKLVYWHKVGINVNKEDPNYDIKQLAVECTAKRIYPDHLSVDKLKEVTGGDPSPMSCRAFLAPHETPFEGRNNLGVCSVNVVRCALRAKELSECAQIVRAPNKLKTKEDYFWEELDKAVALAKEALDVRIATCKKIQAKVAPILYLEGAFGLRAESPDEFVFDRFFSNNRASISLGYIGLYESCMALLGEGPHESTEAHELAIAITKRLKEYTEEWKEAESIGYTLYSTPSEGLAHKFTDADRKIFGVIENITDKEYYQNSFHTDVRFKIHPMEKTLLESSFPEHASGGFIVYNELPKLTHNLTALEHIIDFAMKHTPYFGVNTGVDLCFQCNYKGEITVGDGEFVCPCCGNNDPQQMNVIKRVSGYIGSPNNRPYPRGKWAEILKRVKNTV